MYLHDDHLEIKLVLYCSVGLRCTVLHIRTTGSAKYIPLKAPSSNVIGPWYFKRQCKLVNCDNVKAEINYTIMPIHLT